jgi:hypothetical protein
LICQSHTADFRTTGRKSALSRANSMRDPNHQSYVDLHLTEAPTPPCLPWCFPGAPCTPPGPTNARTCASAPAPWRPTRPPTGPSGTWLALLCGAGQTHTFQAWSITWQSKIFQIAPGVCTIRNADVQGWIQLV